jgi:hypothetical protein
MVTVQCRFLQYPTPQGFAERKLLLLVDVFAACKKIHSDETRKERLAALKAASAGSATATGRLPASPAGGFNQVTMGAQLCNTKRASPEIKVIKETGSVKAPTGVPRAINTTAAVLRAGPLVRHEVRDLTMTGNHPGDGAQARYGLKAEVAVAPTVDYTGIEPTRSRRQPFLQAHVSIAAALGQDTCHNNTLKFPAPKLAALSTPVHSWFVNPAYVDNPNHTPVANGGADASQQGEPCSSIDQQPAGWSAITRLGANNPYLRFSNEQQQLQHGKDVLNPGGHQEASALSRDQDRQRLSAAEVVFPDDRAAPSSDTDDEDDVCAPETTHSGADRHELPAPGALHVPVLEAVLQGRRRDGAASCHGHVSAPLAAEQLQLRGGQGEQLSELREWLEQRLTAERDASQAALAEARQAASAACR